MAEAACVGCLGGVRKCVKQTANNTMSQPLEHIVETDDDRATDPCSRLISAARHKDMEKVKKLLEAGADKEKGLVNYCAVQHAASFGMVEVLKVFQEAGMDMEYSGGSKYASPLWLATYAKHYDVMRFLLCAGVQTDVVYDHGGPVLTVASANNDNVAITMLVDAGADVNVCDEVGLTPLMYVCGRGNGQMAKYLLKHGADVNARDRRGATALHHAVLLCFYEVTLAALLDAGADMYALWNGMTAEECAETLGIRKAVMFFRARKNIRQWKGVVRCLIAFKAHRERWMSPDGAGFVYARNRFMTTMEQQSK